MSTTLTFEQAAAQSMIDIATALADTVAMARATAQDLRREYLRTGDRTFAIAAIEWEIAAEEMVESAQDVMTSDGELRS